MTVYNPFDFFVEEAAEIWPFDYPEDICATISSIYMHAGAGRARCCRPSSTRVDRTPHEHGQLRRRPQRPAAARDRLHHPHGDRRARRRRRRWRAAQGSCRDSSWLLVQALRHLGLAARFVSGYLIQLKPDLVALDGPPGTDHRLHRPARLVRGLSARRRLDRPRPDLRPADRREPRPARRDAALPQRRADLAAMASFANVEFAFDMKVDARRRASAHHQAVLRRELGRRSTRSATRSTRRCRPSDVRLTMGGEPTFVSIDDFESGRMEHRRRRPDQARPGRRADPPAARALRAGRLPALRPGQVVSGRNACRAGPSRSTGARDGKPVWRDPTLIAARRRASTERPAEDAEQLLTAIAGELGLDAEMVDAGLRGPGRMAAQGRQACRTMSIPPIPSSRTPRSAAAWPRSSSAA